MLVSLSGRAHACALALACGWISLFAAAAHGADAAAKDSAASRGEAAEVELFAGIDAGKVEATVIPRDSKRVILQLKNKTAGPLVIRLPETGIAGALETVAALDRDKHILSRDLLAVDLRLPDRVTVRLSNAAAQAREEARKAAKRKGSDA